MIGLLAFPGTFKPMSPVGLEKGLLTRVKQNPDLQTAAKAPSAHDWSSLGCLLSGAA